MISPELVAATSSSKYGSIVTFRCSIGHIDLQTVVMLQLTREVGLRCRVDLERTVFFDCCEVEPRLRGTAVRKRQARLASPQFRHYTAVCGP